MDSKFFTHHRIAKFQNVKVVTKLWKAQIVLPWCSTFNERNKNEKQSVWIISKVLN